MELCKPCFGSKRNITGDNWFTSVPLVDLLEKGLTHFGTIRKNKVEIPEEMTDKTRFKSRQCTPVAYAENFHGGGFGSRSYGGYLCLVSVVCDVTM